MKAIETLKNIDKRVYIGIAIAVVVIICIYKFTDWFSWLSKKSNYKEKVDPNALSYDKSEYDELADKLYTYLSDTSSGLYGVNQDGVYHIIKKMKTASDVYQLIVSYGEREIRKAWHWLGGDKLSLPEAMPKMLSSGELKKVNEILKENNIDYQF